MFRKSFGKRMTVGLALIVIAIVAFGFPIAEARRNGLIVSTGRALKVSFDRGGSWSHLSARFAHGRIHQLRQFSGGRMLAATRGGLFASDRGGLSWERILPEETFAVAEGRGKLFVSTRRGLLVSRDRGDTWRRIESLPEGVVPRSIEIAPSDERTLYIGTDRHGVFSSVDGGENWKPANKGLPRSIGAAPVTPVVNLAVDPRDSRVAYAASEVHGIYKTTDGGEQWEAANVGLPVPLYRRTYPTLIAISPENPDALYAVIGKPVLSGGIVNGLYKTMNGGEQWIEVTGLRPNLMIRSLMINPNNPRELFISNDDGVIRIYDDPRWDVFATHPITEIRALAQQAQCDPDRIGRVEVLNGLDITLMEADRCLFHDFDQNRQVLEFAPFKDDSGKFGGYDVSHITFPFNDAPGTVLPLDDNVSAEVVLPFPFTFYGQPHTTIFINSNGSLTFGSGDPDPEGNELKLVTKQPRISALWNDLHPEKLGAISYLSGPDQFVVTWKEVPEITPDDRTFQNTFQVTLFPDGRIVVKYEEVASLTAMVGISPGGRDQFYQNFTKYFSLLETPTLRFPGDYPIGEWFLEGLYYAEVSRRFYEVAQHEDEYDMLVIYGAPTFDRTITGRIRRFGPFILLATVALPVKNDVSGIGLQTFDNTGFYSSANGRLRLIINMDRISWYLNDPLGEDYERPFDLMIGPKSPMDMLAQMVGHAWGAYVRFDDGGIASDEILSGSERDTWSFFFNSFGSQEDGNWWIGGGDGRFRVSDANFRYSTLDQYLMGLLPASEVGQDPEEEGGYFLIKDPVDTGGRTRTNIPELGVLVQGTKRPITVEDIIRVEGQRNPPPLSKEAVEPMRIGFILVYPPGFPPEKPEDIESSGPANALAKLHLFRCCFEREFKKMTTDRGKVLTGCPEVSRARDTCGQTTP